MPKVLALFAIALALTACGAGAPAASSATPGVATSAPPSPSGAPAATPGFLPADCAAPVRYVALGDSTVLGVGASNPQSTYVARLFTRLQGLYPRAQLFNLGVPGATGAEVARSQLAPALAFHPSLVTVSVGPNDITGGKSAEQFAASLEQVFGGLRDTGAPVVMNLIPDLAALPRFTPEEKVVVGKATVAFNEVVQRLGRQYGVEVVDLYHPTQQEFPRHPEFISSDNYHPSDAGYARWAAIIWSRVEVRIPPACRTPAPR
jgi:lysophospholipase L1-like esterase